MGIVPEIVARIWPPKQFWNREPGCCIISVKRLMPWGREGYHGENYTGSFQGI